MPLFRLLSGFTVSLFFILISVIPGWAEIDQPDFSNENCYTCHGEVRHFISDSAHKDMSCTTCHPNIDSDHLRASDGRIEIPEVSPVSPQNVPETCGACHNQELNTYMDSVHGRALLLGTVKTANCIDCHGSHNAMEVSNPDSTVAAANLPQTCGKCHVAPRDNYAAGVEHQSFVQAGTAPYYTFKFFVWLTILTVIGLILHMEMELLYLFKRARRQK